MNTYFKKIIEIYFGIIVILINKLLRFILKTFKKLIIYKNMTDRYYYSDYNDENDNELVDLMIFTNLENSEDF